MSLELWILAAVAVVGLAAAILVRRRRAGKRAAEPESGNIYPLW